MVIDYEMAYTKLLVYVASKPQHGRDGLTQEMIRVIDECRVSAGELSRLLRLYGVEVERASLIAAETHRAEPERFAGGGDSPGDAELAGHHGPGGHDGRSNGASGARNGRRRV